jgi:hypothetical protein
MLKAIPWEILGPVLAAVIIILFIVFGFILKFQKQSKSPIIPSNPPRGIDETSKKTLCFKHEREIGENATAVRIFGEALQEANRNNSEQHGKLFDKLEEQGTTIIREIHKANNKR